MPNQSSRDSPALRISYINSQNDADSEPNLSSRRAVRAEEVRVLTFGNRSDQNFVLLSGRCMREVENVGWRRDTLFIVSVKDPMLESRSKICLISPLQIQMAINIILD